MPVRGQAGPDLRSHAAAVLGGHCLIVRVLSYPAVIFPLMLMSASLWLTGQSWPAFESGVDILPPFVG